MIHGTPDLSPRTAAPDGPGNDRHDETPGGAPSAESTSAIAEVEEQLSVLAGLIRASMRDAALFIDPSLQPFSFKLLRHIERYGPTHSSAVAAALYVDKSVISRQAKQLCELGLVRTELDPADGRARFLAITELARTKLDAVRNGETAIVHRRLSGWPTDDLHQLAALLAQLNTP